MITIMTKKYNSPMLNVVSIKRSDIIATSNEYVPMGDPGSANDAEAPGMRMFNYYEEY